MALDDKKQLDHIDWQILELLQENARLSYAEIGRRVGLSLPAAAERVRRLEETGIIEGYHTQINPEKLGLSVTAFIRVSVPVEKYPQFTALVRNLAEVLECHHVTGVEAFVMRVVVTSISHLESLVTQLSQYGQTTTSIVMSSPLIRRVLKSPQ
jgi:Lrp/AsnC family leucine-responsive transcriptional regulator